jgi:aminoglycoside phosphotransferase (APT) family kinase protein
MPWFKTALEDLALVERKVAQSRAELLVLEPAIRQDPELSELFDWLKSRWAQEEAGAQKV